MSTPDAFVLGLSSGVTLHLKEGVKVSAGDLVDFKTTAADGAFAEVSQNPSDPTVLGLKNLSQRAWTATLAEGSERQIAPGKNIRLGNGTVVNFGPVVGTVRERASGFSLELPSGSTVSLEVGQKVTASVLLGMKGKGPIAEVSRNPSDPTVLGLKNLTSHTWTAVVPDGTRRSIAPGKNIRLAVGTTINFGGVAGEVDAAMLQSFTRSGSRSSVRPGRLLLSLAVAFLLGGGARFLLGAFVHDKRASDHSQLVATLPVGPDGAQANLPGGGSIDIPKGALDKPTTINVKKRPVEQQVRLDSPSGGAPLVFPPAALSVYELTPIDTVLLRPIELALPIPAGQEVFVFVTANGEHRTLPGVATGGTVRISINNFDFNRPGAITLAR